MAAQRNKHIKYYGGHQQTMDGLADAIGDILREYGDVVYRATDEGLDAAADVLKAELVAASPKKTKTFSKSWKIVGRGRYKLKRYLGNAKTVINKNNKGEEIALANIFEYSTTNGRPFIKRTFENSIPNMAAAVVAKIKEEI